MQFVNSQMKFEQTEYGLPQGFQFLQKEFLASVKLKVNVQNKYN